MEHQLQVDKKKKTNTRQPDKKKIKPQRHSEDQTCPVTEREVFQYNKRKTNNAQWYWQRALVETVQRSISQIFAREHIKSHYTSRCRALVHTHPHAHNYLEHKVPFTNTYTLSHSRKHQPAFASHAHTLRVQYQALVHSSFERTVTHAHTNTHAHKF